MSEHTAESDAAAEAAWIDAELRELHSFVLVETGHIPTCDAILRLRRRVAKALAACPTSPGEGDSR